MYEHRTIYWGADSLVVEPLSEAINCQQLLARRDFATPFSSTETISLRVYWTCSVSCTWSHSREDSTVKRKKKKVVLELRDLTAPASEVLRSKVCATTAQQKNSLLYSQKQILLLLNNKRKLENHQIIIILQYSKELTNYWKRLAWYGRQHMPGTWHSRVWCTYKASIDWYTGRTWAKLVATGSISRTWGTHLMYSRNCRPMLVSL